MMLALLLYMTSVVYSTVDSTWGRRRVNSDALAWSSVRVLHRGTTQASNAGHGQEDSQYYCGMFNDSAAWGDNPPSRNRGGFHCGFMITTTTIFTMFGRRISRPSLAYTIRACCASVSSGLLGRGKNWFCHPSCQGASLRDPSANEARPSQGMQSTEIRMPFSEQYIHINPRSNAVPPTEYMQYMQDIAIACVREHARSRQAAELHVPCTLYAAS